MNNHKHKNCITQKVNTSMTRFSTPFENISSNGGFSFVFCILDSIQGLSLGTGFFPSAATRASPIRGSSVPPSA